MSLTQPERNSPLMRRYFQHLGLTERALSAGIIADTLGISWATGSVGLLTFLIRR
jgi:hypothetical protein